MKANVNLTIGSTRILLKLLGLCKIIIIITLGGSSAPIRFLPSAKEEGAAAEEETGDEEELMSH